MFFLPTSMEAESEHALAYAIITASVLTYAGDIRVAAQRHEPMHPAEGLTQWFRLLVFQ
jgi:hypothetical protein